MARYFLALALGGYAALLLAHPLADALRALDPARAGLVAFALAPLAVALCAALVLALQPRP